MNNRRGDMFRPESLLLPILCCLVTGPVFAGGTTMTTRVNTTNICVASTMKTTFNTYGTTIQVIKQLTGVKMCAAPTINSAQCPPGATGAFTKLYASATSAQLNMNPICQWNCSGCPTITTNGPINGLPVELLEFSVAAEKTETEAEETVSEK